MTSAADRISPDDCGVYTYLDDLKGKKYQIPTFQREIVWERKHVKKLWDSIYRFYPLGSILIWRTDIRLHEHRQIGGHVISDDFSRQEYRYILDGQQRTTALFTSLYGGTIEGREDFDPTLYFDLTIQDEEELDEESYKKRFLFWDEIDDRGGELRANIGKKKRFDEGLIVKLIDIKQDYTEIERRLSMSDYDYDHPYRVQLRKIRQVFDNYRISFIELRGIQVPEVCQIFERINQAGEPLDIFDIVVAKTYRPPTEESEGFYLRDLVDGFREETDGNFVNLDDHTFLQMIAVLIREELPDAGILNITDRYLNDIRTEHIEAVWSEAETVFLKLFDFFENHLHLKGPGIIPYRYFYMALATYLLNNVSPDYDFLKKYFWFYSFHNDDLLRNTTHLRNHIDFLRQQKQGEKVQFDRFLIDRHKLRTSSYSSRGRLSRAVLSLFANNEPRDWANPDKKVLLQVYYLLTDKPNLHHVLPRNFMEENPGENQLDYDSLMNIVYLPQITNIQISDDNPVQYITKYDGASFEKVLEGHLMPDEILQWARQDELPADSLDVFIERRIDLVIDELRERLSGIGFEVIDTQEVEGEIEDITRYVVSRA
jgi:hypothetical protein